MSRFSLEKETVVAIIASKIKSSPEVAEQVANFIVSNAISDITSAILHALMSDKPLRLPEKGDYVSVKIPYGHEKSEFNRDVLEELGLLVKNRVFGIVKGAAGYRSEDDPYYYEHRIDLIYHDDDKKIKKFEKTFSIFDIKVIEKSEIPYFNGTNIKTLAKHKLPRMVDAEEDDQPF